MRLRGSTLFAPKAPPLDDPFGSGNPSQRATDAELTLIAFFSIACETTPSLLRNLSAAAELRKDLQATGVHTPRFAFETSDEVLRGYLDRKQISIPVIYDGSAINWNRYNPPGWPSVVAIDRSGRAVEAFAGFTSLANLLQVADKYLLPEHVTTLQEDITQKDVTPEDLTPKDLTQKHPCIDSSHQDSKTHTENGGAVGSSQGTTGRLGYPSSIDVLIDADRPTLCVVDEGTNRILIGELAEVHSATPKLVVSSELTVPNPSAAAWLDPTALYIISGNEVLIHDLDSTNTQVVTDELPNPAAIMVDTDSSLLVADAALNQIFRIEPNHGPRLIAGSGNFGRIDGPAGQATLAQPVSLSRTEAGVIFCDAASSNVRLLTDLGEVLSITNNPLYGWALADGPAHSARLQRPSAANQGIGTQIYIADTGNNAIRMLNNGAITTLPIQGLNRPEAVAQLPSGQIIVADTHGKRLVLADKAAKRAANINLFRA